MDKQSGFEEKRRYWRGVVEEWLDSGLGMAEFSRKRGVNPKQFLYWRQVLRKEGGDWWNSSVPTG